jgi:hypothetical protein
LFSGQALIDRVDQKPYKSGALSSDVSGSNGQVKGVAGNQIHLNVVSAGTNLSGNVGDHESGVVYVAANRRCYFRTYSNL